jgi:fructoselysine 6-kinase
MKFIGVGDNVVDCYLDQRAYYPGGNAVNVAVNVMKFGRETDVERSAYLGIFGNDREAEHIKKSLSAENVEWNHSRVVAAISGHPGVKLNEDGDRIFTGGPKNTAQHIVRLNFTDDDFNYIKQFDLCHTSCYSLLEDFLPALSKCCPLSFDFSDEHNDDYIARVAPHLTYAFFSGSDLSDKEIDRIIALCHKCGAKIVGITLGSRGALFSRAGECFTQGVTPVPKMVDTMGAGDSFIAGFLLQYHSRRDMKAALAFAARCASQTCAISGSFGHPHVFEG